MALDVLTQANVTVQMNWNASKNQTGLTGLSSVNLVRDSFSYSLGSSAAKINEIYSTILTVTPSGSTTLTLSTGLTNVVGTASITLARIKAIFIWLMGTGDTVNGVAGTAASAIVVGNAASHPWQFFFDAATDTITLNNGTFFAYAGADATGWAVSSGSSDQLKIANSDSGVSAKVLVTLYGAAS